MKVGDEFTTFDEFEEKLKEYRNNTFYPMFIYRNARTVDNTNKKTKGDIKLKQELRYSSFDVQCSHYGHYETQAKQVN